MDKALLAVPALDAKTAVHAATAANVLKRVTSTMLLGPAREMVIEHNGREYRLRLTQNDKLILTA